MDDLTYGYIAQQLYKSPPSQNTPEGQKFHIGEIVKISNPSSWFAKRYHKKNPNALYEIEYSYWQKFSTSIEDLKKAYSLKWLSEDKSNSWYDENELELVKGIDEINEERDLSEYKRLKAKYEEPIT